MFLFKCFVLWEYCNIFHTVCCLQVCELPAGGTRGGGDRSRPGPGWQYNPQTLHQCSEGNSHSASGSFPRLAASFMCTGSYVFGIYRVVFRGTHTHQSTTYSISALRVGRCPGPRTRHEVSAVLFICTSCRWNWKEVVSTDVKTWCCLSVSGES